MQWRISRLDSTTRIYVSSTLLLFLLGGSCTSITIYAYKYTYFSLKFKVCFCLNQALNHLCVPMGWGMVDYCLTPLEGQKVLSKLICLVQLKTRSCTVSLWLILAPACRRAWTTSTWPLSAASDKGLAFVSYRGSKDIINTFYIVHTFLYLLT